MKIKIALLTCIIIFSGCNTYPGITTKSKPNYSTSLDEYLEFVPIMPKKPEHSQSYKGTDKDNYLNNTLINTESYVQVSSMNVDGTFSYSGSTVTGKAGKYQVIMDFSKYIIEEIITDENFIGSSKIGVSFRVIAQLVTTECSIDVSSLTNIGIASKFGLLSGTLYINVIGVSSKKIIEMIPISSTIDITSIIQIINTLENIKNLLYDDETVITPQIIAIRQNEKNTFSQIDNYFAAYADEIFNTAMEKIDFIINKLNQERDPVKYFLIVLESIDEMEASTKEAYSNKSTSISTIKGLLISDAAAKSTNINLIYKHLIETEGNSNAVIND